jgi:SAM-dependent methyltransferase
MPDAAAMGQYSFTDADASAQAVRQLIAVADPVARNASLNVARDDDMFAFDLGLVGATSIAAMAYFREGASMVGLIEKVATWRFGGWAGVGSFLDFAAGYGRTTRFVVEHLPAERVTVGEIQRDALEFQEREFGVKTLASTSDPDELESSTRFDLVFVASLFTHLPDRTFGMWLAKLWELVAPGGVLVFSVHDEAINRGAVPLHDGFAFIPRSEASALSVEDYGTNFTTADYVRRRLETAIGADAGHALRLPRALCFEQDVWVVPRGGSPIGPLEYECGPIGAVDRFDVRGRTLEVTGWAADRGAAAVGAPTHDVAGVEVLVSGASAAVVEVNRGARPDVAEYLGNPDDPRFRLSGWTLRGNLKRRPREDDVVSIITTCEHGASFVIDSSRVDHLLARMQLPPATSRIRRYIIGARYALGQGGARALAARILVVFTRDVRPLFRRSTLDRVRRRLRR